jgi:hypothetical protein
VIDSHIREGRSPTLGVACGGGVVVKNNNNNNNMATTWRINLHYNPNASILAVRHQLSHVIAAVDTLSMRA